jgi:hypothetical protein
LSNPEEFSFTSDEETSEQTLRRAGHQARDQKRLDTLKKKLHTDDERKKYSSVGDTYTLAIILYNVASYM